MNEVASHHPDLLRVVDLHAWYGASHVLQGVDLRVGAGELVSLLGRNGSGRSTTARAIMGMLVCRGLVEFGGQDVSRLKTYERAGLGLGYVPETRDVFPALTVEQNLVLGMKGRRPGRWRQADMYELFPQLERRARTPAQALSGGEQQMLSLCRTLMGDPALIVIDEPTEGLAPLLVEQVAAFLVTLKREGVSVLLIEQRLDIALQISDRVYVLGHGKVAFEGTPQALREDEALRRTWIAL